MYIKSPYVACALERHLWVKFRKKNMDCGTHKLGGGGYTVSSRTFPLKTTTREIKERDDCAEMYTKEEQISLIPHSQLGGVGGITHQEKQA